LSQNKYRQMTGNYNATYQEHSRRKKKYSQFLNEISSVKRYTCDEQNLTDYIKVISKFFISLKNEKFRKDRRKNKWNTRMQTDSTLARTANKMFGLRSEENMFKESNNWKILSSDQKKELRAKWRKNIEERKNKHRIVFFGNGTSFFLNLSNGWGRLSMCSKKKIFEISCIMWKSFLRKLEQLFLMNIGHQNVVLVVIWILKMYRKSFLRKLEREFDVAKMIEALLLAH
jgi:hypothetical protein